MNIRHGDNLFAVCRERGWDWRDLLDLSANINPLGPAPAVRSAILAALDQIARYPDEFPTRLAECLAAHWHIPESYVLCGNGVTELTHFFARTGWQGPVAVAVPTTSEYHHAFPHALKVSLDEPETWPQRGLLVLTQPNRMTGELMEASILRRAIAAREGPVMVDESYLEFTGAESAVSWCEYHPNLLVLRSLSKFYALPGLRVGALVSGPEWLDRLRKRREPWQVSALAEIAAIAAVEDSGYAEKTRELIDGERAWLVEQVLEWPGVELRNSQANYLFAELERSAEDVCRWFLDRRILLRNCTGLPGVSGEAVRFAVRTREENQRFVEAGKEHFCSD